MHKYEHAIGPTRKSSLSVISHGLVLNLFLFLFLFLLGNEGNANDDRMFVMTRSKLETRPSFNQRGKAEAAISPDRGTGCKCPRGADARREPRARGGTWRYASARPGKNLPRSGSNSGSLCAPLCPCDVYLPLTNHR
jgi:hypothetical protein